jgi:predicted transcriptional regulator
MIGARSAVDDTSRSTIGHVETTSLGPLEQRVMAHLWRHGPATVRDVVAGINDASERKLAYTTVLTILVRLDEKGYVDRTKEGRQFRYAAAVSEAEIGSAIGRRELQRLIDRHGAESLAAFAEDLVGADAELTARLRALAAERGGE